MNAPGTATSADLTRMNAEMTELGLRHRRAMRSVMALLALFALCALGIGYFAFTNLRDTRSGPPAAALSPRVPAPVPVPVPDSPAPPSSPLSAPPTQLAQTAPKPLHSLPRPANKEPATTVAVVAPPASVAPVLSAPAPKPEAAPSFGFLTIDTSPWSLVSVGGRPLGQTPLMNVKLPAGSQVLSLRNPEQGIETSYPVTIESGKTTVRRIGIE
jgi:serine/threonine-protein kinase